MKNNKQRPRALIIYGPTGVGKTDLALAVAQQIPAEIINMDMGQFYAPFSIGTAKPDWKNSTIPHHFFDIINEPRNYTVIEYRAQLLTTLQEIMARGKLPIIVGGSGFYLYSLFFCNQNFNGVETANDNGRKHIMSDVARKAKAEGVSSQSETGWNTLYDIDPQRALHVQKNDIYRIQRALDIWHTTGKLPSSYIPTYDPPVDFVVLCITRDRQELNKRINERVDQMIQQGWLDEVQQLQGTEWEHFIEEKKLIGYNELLGVVKKKNGIHDISLVTDIIKQRTRQYAKRQSTFWRKFERDIKKVLPTPEVTAVGCLEMVNMTNKNSDLYSNELLQRLHY